MSSPNKIIILLYNIFFIFLSKEVEYKNKTIHNSNKQGQDVNKRFLELY
jgi:hypothetical protein